MLRLVPDRIVRRMNDQIGETVGTVATLSRFPVKSMQGERLTTAELTEHGVVGDRARTRSSTPRPAR